MPRIRTLHCVLLSGFVRGVGEEYEVDAEKARELLSDGLAELVLDPVAEVLVAPVAEVVIPAVSGVTVKRRRT